MATNQRYGPSADHIYVPNVPAGTKSGDPVLVGAIRGVAKIDRDSDGGATVWLVGSYDLEVTGEANFGDLVYLEQGEGGEPATLNTDQAGKPFGVAYGSKGSGEGDLEVAPLGLVATAPDPAS